MTAADLYHRYRVSLGQFLTFGLIGGSGVLVNMLVFALANNVAYHVFGSHEYDRFWSIPGTSFAIRNYLVHSVIAFVVANLYNFLLNRHWTFRAEGGRAPFLQEYGPFLLVGSIAQLLGLVILLLLMNPSSPLFLSSDFFVPAIDPLTQQPEDTVGPFWRKRAYWAQFIQIVCVMPINFVVNKLWTFRAVRRRHAERVAARG